MTRMETTTEVPSRARPSAGRAAAAARLAGAPAGRDDVAHRMRAAARRSAATPKTVPAKVGATRPSPTRRSTERTGGPIHNPEIKPADRRTLVRTAGSAALAVAFPRRNDRPEDKEAERSRHLRVVPDGALSAAQRRRRARAALIASIAGATLIGLTLVYLHVVLAQRQFALDKMSNQITQAQATYQERRLQVARLSSPANIISEAEGQLGMVQPDSVDYLTPPAGSAATQSGPTSQTQQQPLGQASTKATVPASGAPAGEADWPVVKSELAGQQ